MTLISALKEIHLKGLFGNYKNKHEDELTKVSEIKDLLIVQIVKYEKTISPDKSIKIDNLDLPGEKLKVNCNKDTRVLWCGPGNWLITSNEKNLLKNILELINNKDFAITDLSHSRAIIQLEGKNIKEILKKGCPYNFNELKKDRCINSVFNGITITIDMIEDNPNKIRLFALRSFGESLYHSITDACLEDGYKSV